MGRRLITTAISSISWFNTYLKTGVECGVDPYTLVTAQGGLLNKEHVFQQREGETTDAFLERVAKDHGLRLQKLGAYRYFDNGQGGTDNSFAEALFARRDDIMSAAAGLRPRVSGGNGTVAPLVAMLIQSEDEKKRMIKAAQDGLAKARGAYYRAQTLERGSTLTKPDTRAAAIAYEEAGRELSEVTRIYNDSMHAFWRSGASVPDVFGNALGFLPNSLVEEAYLRTLYNYTETCLYILDQGAKLYNDPDNISKITDLVMKQQALLAKKIQEFKKRTKSGEESYARAVEYWKNKDYANAYREYCLLFDVIEDYSAKTRLGCALLAVKLSAARVQALEKLVVSPPAGGRYSPVDAQGLLGMDSAMQDAIGKYLKTTIRTSRQGGNPGRVGAGYGLVVNHARMEGRYGSFGIQFLAKKGNNNGNKKSQPDNKAKLEMNKLDSGEAGDFEIELQAVGQAVMDDSFKASISDALRYVQGNHYPDLASKRILIIFDDSVGVAYGGDSAGAVISIACISRALGKEPRANVCMTGAVRAYGDVRPIGGLMLKAGAAADNQFGIILVPEGNLAELKLLDLDRLGTLQIITGRTMSDYIRFAIPQKDDEKKEADAILKKYALGYTLYKAGDYPEALAAMKLVLKDCPNHYSAASLAGLMEMAGVKPAPLPEELAKLTEPPAPEPVPVPAATPAPAGGKSQKTPGDRGR